MSKSKKHLQNNQINKSHLAEGNRAMRARDFRSAMHSYRAALDEVGGDYVLRELLTFNLDLAKNKYWREQKSLTQIFSQEPCSSRIAVVMHAFYPELLPELFQKLESINVDYDLFVTIPETVEKDVLPALNAYKKKYSTIICENIGADVFPFLKLVPELNERGYRLVCKIHTKRNHDDFGPLWRQCLLDGVLGNESIVTEIIHQFEQNPNIQAVGPSLLFLPMLSASYDMLPLLRRLQTFCPNAHSVDDWGFFAGTMFWARVSTLKMLIDVIPVEKLTFNEFASGHVSGAPQLYERLFGLLPVIAGGSTGLVDYRIISNKNIEKEIRVVEKDVPSPVPTKYRLRTFRLIQNNLLARHLLIYQAGILDPYYMLSKNPVAVNQQIDCAETYLLNPEKSYVSADHEKGDVQFNFDEQQLNVINKNINNSIFVPHIFASEAMIWTSKNQTKRSRQCDIKVSVWCVTYNHEKYIKEALDGFLMQKTNFKFQVVIGDDCSTDKTTEIIQEYVDQYPDLFVFLKREKNIGARANSLEVRRLLRGEYVALNEGDDYWTDPHKLQKQADYLDAHPECTLCFHPVKVIDQINHGPDTVFPSDLIGTKFSIADLVERNFIQTNSVMYRWQFHDAEDAALESDLVPEDWYSHILHAQFGEVHMLDETMAVYRKHSTSMWSSFESHNARMEVYGLKHLKFFRSVNKLLGHYYHLPLLNSMKNMFVTLGDQFYTEFYIQRNAEKILKLVSENRDIAPIALYFLGWPDSVQHANSAKIIKSELCSKIKVSTIITSYNHEKYIEKCLDSVIAQHGFFDHEVIVADDCSTDGTWSKIQDYAKRFPSLLHVLPRQSNVGMLQNMRRALNACTGDFVAICEGDDYWLSSEKLHKQIAFLLVRPELAMCFNWVALQNGTSAELNPHHQQSLIVKDRINFEELLPMDLPANFSCCLYRRSAIDWIPDCYYHEENAADWLFNLCIAYYTDIGFIKEQLSVYRLHENGQWTGLSDEEKKQRMNAEYQRFLRYFPPKSDVIKSYVR